MTSNKEWKILLLDSDEFSSEIKKFIQGYYPFYSAKIKNTSYKKKILRRIRNIAKKNKISNDDRILTLMSDGHFHHFTYGLCRVFADTKSKEYCYMHFDAHTDDASKGGYLIDCATFVNHILLDTNAKFAYFIGYPRKVFYREKNTDDLRDVIIYKDLISINKIPPEKLLSHLNHMPNEVYISLDLDFLQDKYITTGFSNKDISIFKLLKYLEIIKKEKDIIGADILGYANKTFSDEYTVSEQEIKIYEEDKEKSLKTYKTLIDCLLEK